MLALKMMAKVSGKKLPALNFYAVLSTARNGHSVRLGNFSNKFKITICALSIACTNKRKKCKTLQIFFYEKII